MNTLTKLQKGFTLIEIMVSITIFSIIMTVGMAAVVSILNTYGVSKKEKQVYESLNYSIESMTREMRLGGDFYGGALSTCSTPLSNTSTCSSRHSSNDASPTSDSGSFGFESAENRGYIVYYVENETLFAKRYGATNSRLNGIQALTDPDQVEITKLRFSVFGTAPRSASNYKQPLVWLQIQAKAKGQDRISTIQTFISQRTLDVN